MKLFSTVLLSVALASFAFAADEVSEKGSFGVVINQNFVTFSYVATYIGKSTTEGHVAFELAFKDNKGYDVPSEIEDDATYLKSGRNEIRGKTERKSPSSVLLLFPLPNGEDLEGSVTLYTKIFGSKLKKKFRL
ncbi:hypothetical protein ACFL4X_00670 [Gemmatimonadota bacterium]